MCNAGLQVEKQPQVVMHVICVICVILTLREHSLSRDSWASSPADPDLPAESELPADPDMLAESD